MFTFQIPANLAFEMLVQSIEDERHQALVDMEVVDWPATPVKEHFYDGVYQGYGITRLHGWVVKGRVNRRKGNSKNKRKFVRSGKHARSLSVKRYGF
jgi:hypothetical protein